MVGAANSEAVKMRVPSGLKIAAVDVTGLIEDVELLAGRRVPDPCSAVDRASKDLSSVRAEHCQLQHAFMALEDGKRLSVGGVPNSRGLIERRCNDAVSFRTESAMGDGIFMAKDGVFLIPGQSAEQSGFGLGHIGPFGTFPPRWVGPPVPEG